MHWYKKNILILFFLLLHSVLIAQQQRMVSGDVLFMPVNTKIAKVLPYASVVVVNQNDSSFVAGGTSDSKGHFNIRYQDEKEEQYLVRVSYLGYATAFRPIKKRSVVFNTGNIVLQKKGIELEEVTITAKEPDIKMIGDTTIINALAYSVPDGAYLQDLVRRIPGLEYDENSHLLTYNGLPIHEININGEAFFAGNTRIPLENLPADFIKSLKVYDKSTDTELATGMDDGLGRYVLDLQTKAEINETYLASVKAGYGNNRKKAREAQFNYFRKGGDNFSVFASSGNKNQNSTYKNNITNSVATNLSHKFGKKISLTGNVQYNNGRTGNITNSYREQYLTNTNQYTSSAREAIQKNRMLSSNWRVLWNVNKRTHVNFSIRSGLNKNNSDGNYESATFSASPGLDIKDPFSDFDTVVDSVRINHRINIFQNNSRALNYACKANIIRKLNKKGSNISFLLEQGGRWSKKNNLSENTITYFQQENATGNDSVLYSNQIKHAPVHADNLSVGTAFTHPLGKRVRLQLSYKYNLKKETNNSDTYDLSTGEQLYVDSLKNRSYSRYNMHNIGLHFNYSNKVWKINAGATVAPGQRKINRRIGVLYADTTMRVCDLNSLLRIVWKNKKRYRVTFSYGGSTRFPSLSQIVPLTDNSNPLYITRGNPGLKNTYAHSLRLDMQNLRKGISASANWRAEQNSITQVTIYNEETGGSETYPENINGNWSARANGRWRKRFNKFEMILELTGNYKNNVSMLSEDEAEEPQRCVTRNMSVDSRYRFSYNPKWGNISIKAGNIIYHSLNTLQNSSSYTRKYNLGMNTYAELPWGVQLRTDIAYSLRRGTNLQNNDNNEIMWNLGLSRRFMAGKKAELALYWADILSQRKAYERNADSNGFYENYTRQTKGYVMLSLKYNFRQIK